MLITSFSAGELSENLFGRTDIAQYYSGASRLENFDVIPTGGLRRRSGMERIRKLVRGEGRLIPFIVNRGLNFLLYLTPGRITAYKISGGQIAGETEFSSAAGGRLYESLSHIRAVRYAQNFDTMILCHEDYAPIEVKLINNNSLSVSAFVMDFDVEVVSGVNVTNIDEEQYEPQDKQYRENGWLAVPGCRPASVCFFNGRLFFACTSNSRQRVFASAVKKEKEPYYNFSTYKRFLTEKREYATFFGTIDADDTARISTGTGIISGLTRRADQYYVDSLLYPEGTRVEKINLNEIILSSGTEKPGLVLNVTAISKEIESKMRNFNTLQETPIVYDLQKGTTSSSLYDCKIIIRPNSITLVCVTITGIPMNPDPKERYVGVIYLGDLSEEEIKIIVGGNTPERREITERIRTKIISEGVKEGYTGTVNYGIIDSAIAAFFDFVRTFCWYSIETPEGKKEWFGDPNEFGYKILEFINGFNGQTCIALYSREIIMDEYPTPDCGFTFEVASDANDAIRWLAVNRGLIIGTEMGEFVMPPDVHATNVYVVPTSRYGSAGIQGKAVGDAIIFFQSGCRVLTEYRPNENDHFRANNMAMMNPEMLSESPAVEFDFTASPYTKLLITREDGAMAALLYERGTGTFAWGRISTAGKIKSAAVVPGEKGSDDIYLIVLRNGAHFLERLSEDGEVYLDSFSKPGGSTADYPGAVTDGGFTGYPYESVVRSMPILANNEMSQNNIKNLLIRFLDSFMPKLKSLPGGQVDTIPMGEPFSGVHKVPFPGTWDHDVMFEFICDKPQRTKLLAINAEVN